MNRTRSLRILLLLIGVAALAAVVVVAYHAGLKTGPDMTSRMPFGPFRGGYKYGPGFGFGFGFFAFLPMLVIGFLLVWLFVSLISPSGGTRGGTSQGAVDPSGVEKLRELTELHDRGALSDEEFTAAKRKLLGL
jgi:uncharacterized membrane protein